MTPKEIAYIALHYRTMTPRAIGEALSRDAKTIREYIAKHGWEGGVGTRAPRYARETIEAVCAERWTADRADLARRFGMSEQAVSSCWDRYRFLIPPAPPRPAKPAAPTYAVSNELGIIPVPGYGGISVARVSCLAGGTA